jgi:hypothetical protein
MLRPLIYVMAERMRAVTLTSAVVCVLRLQHAADIALRTSVNFIDKTRAAFGPVH